MFDADPYDYTPEQAADLLADRLEEHFRALGLAVSLHELGISREGIEHVADVLTHGGATTVGNYSPLTRDDVIAVLELAY